VTLKKINNVLLALIILVNGYVIVAPFVPVLLFHIESQGGSQKHHLNVIIHKIALPSTQQQSPQPNHVIIPAMLLNQPIYEGTVTNQYKTLDKGIWHWPRSSTPDKGGNTVLIGHRFTYTNPEGVFYFLNKVKPGDEIGVFWANHQYLYKVVSVNEVPPNDTAIEDNTSNPELTLFTCTPLWFPKDRLVVVANLEAKP